MRRVLSYQRLSDAPLSPLWVRDSPRAPLDQALEIMEKEKMKLTDRAEEILETMWVGMVEEGKGSLPTGPGRKAGRHQGAQPGRLYPHLGWKGGAGTRGKERGREDHPEVPPGREAPRGRAPREARPHPRDRMQVGAPSQQIHPPGRRCARSLKEIVQVVPPLKELNAGERGTIAYLAIDDDTRLHKLMAMGALPGLRVAMIQEFPFYVFKVGESQFPIDGQMAKGIYVSLRKI